MHLNTMQVDDWSEFIEKTDLDLSCPACRGEGEVKDEKTGEVSCCEDCGGSGFIEPLWNVIWYTGFTAKGDLPRQCGEVFAFEHGGNVWLGLSACGMNLTPHLARAWLEFFPDCRWLPRQFCVTGVNLTHGYVASCIGDEDAARVYRVMEQTFKAEIRNAQDDLEDLAKVFPVEGREVCDE